MQKERNKEVGCSNSNGRAAFAATARDEKMLRNAGWGLSATEEKKPPLVNILQPCFTEEEKRGLMMMAFWVRCVGPQTWH